MRTFFIDYEKMEKGKNKILGWGNVTYDLASRLPDCRIIPIITEKMKELKKNDNENIRIRFLTEIKK